MANPKVSIAIVAPSCRLQEEAAAKVAAFARDRYGDRLSLFIHPQCFLKSGHFAGDDAARSKAFLEVANDPSFDAVWFARGGYGACRIDDAVFGALGEAARRKVYLGYSDTGFLLARIARNGRGRSVHGPMPSDVMREGGEAAVARSLAWLVDRDAEGLEPSLNPGDRAFAFNLTVLSNLLGTPAEPDLSDAVLMIEDIDEHHYELDRTLFHVTSSDNVRRSSGLRLGRVSKIPPNDPAFEKTEIEIIEYWCERSGIPFLGSADIGHDAANKIVPFPTANVKLA